MVAIRCTASTMVKKQRMSIQAAVLQFYNRIIEGEESSKDASKKRNKAGRHADYAKALKTALDNALEPHWHVIVGNSLAFMGYACKYRERTSGIWRIAPTKDGKELRSDECLAAGLPILMVVIWKSPGIEEVVREIVDDATPAAEDKPDEAAEPSASSRENGDDTTTTAENNTDEAAEPSASSRGPSLHVIRPPAAEVEAGSEAETAIGVLRDAVQRHCKNSKDAVDLAKELRRRLTKELGTIWHVAVGKEFVYEPPINCQNYVLASFGKDMQIVCFQHEQRDATKIAWSRIASSLPWLLVVLVCFGYMAGNSICESSDPPEGMNIMARAFHHRVCTKKDWEQEFGAIAIVTLIASFVAKRFVKEK